MKDISTTTFARPLTINYLTKFNGGDALFASGSNTTFNAGSTVTFAAKDSPGFPIPDTPASIVTFEAKPFMAHGAYTAVWTGTNTFVVTDPSGILTMTLVNAIAYTGGGFTLRFPFASGGSTRNVFVDGDIILFQCLGSPAVGNSVSVSVRSITTSSAYTSLEVTFINLGPTTLVHLSVAYVVIGAAPGGGL